ncbi:MAG: glycosyltransferase family 2 protein [Anaerolineaceae bacterium]|nr:glycosyltransferase family 2 protein [Anaerolineaceae bacterium]
MNPFVSVIIPCRNEEKTIHLVLDALHKQSYPLDEMEVVIADGLSTDGTRRAIQAFSNTHPKLRIRLVDNHKQIIPAALNTAIQAATGDIIVRMDAHSLPVPDYIQRCVDALLADKAENVGGVWKIAPQNTGWIARSIAAAAANPLAVGDARYRFTDKAGYQDTVPYGAYKRDLFKRIGYFDENLLANEDYEFNTRIRQSGGRIWLDPAIECTYFARPTLKALAKQYWGYGYWKAQMLKRYPDTLRWRQALPPVFVLSLIALALAGFFWRPAWLGLGAMVGLYLLIQLIAAIRISLKQEDLKLAAGIVLATITMHLSWGIALIAGLFSTPDRK